MIRDNIRIIRDYFKLVKGSKKHIFIMILSSIIFHSSSLLMPVFAANIIYEITNKNMENTYMNILLLAIMYIINNVCLHANYVAFSYNFKYSYKNLREKIVDKLFTYDTEFSDRISKGAILNTVKYDAEHLSEMIDNVCEIIIEFIKILIMIGIFLKTNLFVGVLVVLLEYIYIKSYDYCNIKSAKYLTSQEKYNDKLTDNLSQILNGLGEIKTFNIFDKIKNSFYNIANKWSIQYIKRRKYINIKCSLLPFITYLGEIMLYVILVYLVFRGDYQVNTLYYL